MLYYFCQNRMGKINRSSWGENMSLKSSVIGEMERWIEHKNFPLLCMYAISLCFPGSLLVLVCKKCKENLLFETIFPDATLPKIIFPHHSTSAFSTNSPTHAHELFKWKWKFFIPSLKNMNFILILKYEKKKFTFSHISILKFKIK